MGEASMSTILVVDDDEDIRDAVRDTLSDEGYEVEVAGDGQGALRWIREHGKPSLILLDWNMAPMNGPAFMEALGKEPALVGSPVVLLTADVRVAPQEPPLGCAGFLRKPVSLKALLETVGRHVHA